MLLFTQKNHMVFNNFASKRLSKIDRIFHAPLFLPASVSSASFTLILRPFNFETFATKAYAYASQDLLEAAALPSLFLIFWSAR